MTARKVVTFYSATLHLTVRNAIYKQIRVFSRCGHCTGCMNPPYNIKPNATSTVTFESVCLPFQRTTAEPDCKPYDPEEPPTFPLKLVAKKTDQHDCEIVKGKLNYFLY